jgi:hypothetical protein
MYQTIRRHNPQCIMNPLHFQHLKSCTNKNNWSMYGNVTLGKLNYTRMVSVFKLYLILHIFFTSCVHCVLYFVSQHEETRSEILPGYRHYLHKYIFWGSGPHMMNFRILLKFYHIDIHILKITYNVECYLSRSKCLHYTKLLQQKI